MIGLPILSVQSGGFLEHTFSIAKFSPPDNVRVSALIRSSRNGPIIAAMECAYNVPSQSVTLRLNSVRTATLEAGRKFYSVEIQIKGNKIVDSNYLLIEP